MMLFPPLRTQDEEVKTHVIKHALECASRGEPNAQELALARQHMLEGFVTEIMKWCSYGRHGMLCGVKVEETIERGGGGVIECIKATISYRGL